MSAGLEVADVFRRHGDAYRRAHDAHLGRIERRVMSAIELCRTAALGGHTEACAECGLVRCAYNRHCPKCQGQARSEWLAARQAELLPVPYFHVVFTLPTLAGEIAFQNKATVYAILFRSAAETLATIAADPRHLGAQIGVTAVLHTWGQTLQHHPHVHCVVPGGGPSLDGTDRLPARVLPARARALTPVPSIVPAGPAGCLRCRQTALLR
jgi:Transposase zinc-binding domain/Putative transposase